MKGPGFYPEEIIFSATTECNLHCSHCFVHRQQQRIKIEDAVTLMQSCQGTSICKIGFSGGEPFLYLEFLLEITKQAVKMDYLFDQIMTNGDWWQTENDLINTLQQLYDAGYDGKIGLSWDNFHGQTTERMTTFIKNVQKIFGDDSINIQYVADKGGESLPLSPKSSAAPAGFSATPSAGQPELQNNAFSSQPEVLQNSCPATPQQQLTKELIQELFPDVTIYELPQTYYWNNQKGWQAEKWFIEDYCQGPGNILFVHPDGNIAPCCGFANEEEKLFIGTINDDFEKIIKNAEENPMIKLCFTKGLSSRIKEWKKLCKKNKNLPLGKTADICTFCQSVCKNLSL